MGNTKKKLNTSLGSVGISPANLHSIPQQKHSRIVRAKDKLSKVIDKDKVDLSNVYNIKPGSLDDGDSVCVQSKEEIKKLAMINYWNKEKSKLKSFLRQKKYSCYLVQVIDLVVYFYEDDEFSRTTSGEKDCVSLGNSILKQKP